MEDTNFLDEDLVPFTTTDEESEDDLNERVEEFLSDIFLSGTDWTVETIINQLERKNIDLNPSFQRRDAWNKSRKSRFIESLFLGIPVPQIVLAEHATVKGKFIVIDGKQRLLSLRQFASTKEDDAFEQLKLTGLKIKKELNRKSYQTLLANPEYADMLSGFQNETIRTVVIRNWKNEDALYLIFHRMNTESVKLSTQELRQALHPGPFLEYANAFTADSKVFHSILKNQKADFRMRDTELLIRHLAFINHLETYSGNLKSFLDSACKKLNSAWDEHQGTIIDQIASLEYAITATVDIFGPENAFRTWTGKSFERHFNRAVFDVMAYYFRDEKIRALALGSKDAVIDSYKTLCATNKDFYESIRTTTKSLTSTSSRLILWGEVLSNAIKSDIPTPSLDEKTNRIKR